MRKLGVFQLLGPVALFLALAAADAAAYALQRAPSCEWLWWLNLRGFEVFQRSHYALAAITGADHSQLAWIALPLLAAAVLGTVYRRSLLLALSSNLSFIYIVFVAIVWAGFHPEAQASLAGGLPVTIHPDTLVLVPLVGFSLVSFVVSHAVYLMKVRAEPLR
jgi:hypothetical protein